MDVCQCHWSWMQVLWKMPESWNFLGSWKLPSPGADSVHCPSVWIPYFTVQIVHILEGINLTLAFGCTLLHDHFQGANTPNQNEATVDRWPRGIHGVSPPFCMLADFLNVRVGNRCTHGTEVWETFPPLSYRSLLTPRVPASRLTLWNRSPSCAGKREKSQTYLRSVH